MKRGYAAQLGERIGSLGPTQRLVRLWRIEPEGRF